MALDYINQKGLKPLKTLLKAIEELRSRDEIVVMKPDKGSGIVVMNKSEYLRLLSEALRNTEIVPKPFSQLEQKFAA